MKVAFDSLETPKVTSNSHEYLANEPQVLTIKFQLFSSSPKKEELLMSNPLISSYKTLSLPLVNLP